MCKSLSFIIPTRGINRAIRVIKTSKIWLSIAKVEVLLNNTQQTLSLMNLDCRRRFTSLFCVYPLTQLIYSGKI